jgi:N-carbamoylputrescine amidase
MKDVRIALVVMNCPVARNRENLERVGHWTREAARQGVQILCFPELCISGYTTRSAAAASAEGVPGPSTDILQQLARQEKMVILAGLAERDDAGNVYAGHLVVTPKGLAGSYRKVHIAPPERGVFTAGSSVPLFRGAGTRFGIQLCYDAHFPELTTRMALEGADLIFMPHASPRGTSDEKFDSWTRHLTARAFDNGLFVAACNQTGSNAMGLHFPGLAVVVGPTGEVIARATDAKEGLLVTDLKAAALRHVREHRMRYFLPNRRPEIYRP